jgi:hypothetical protein
VRRAALAVVLLGAQLHRAAAQPTPAPAERPPDESTEQVPAPDAAAPAALKASSDDIDLSALGLEPGGASFDDKLNIYGFADVGWMSQHLTRDNAFLKRDIRGFAVGNLNIYLAKNLTAKARTLAEVRFTLLPNGSPNIDGTAVDTTALDVTNFYRPTQWGGIVIERAYVEYDLTDHLTIRVGHWLTPYGVWNIDHGSPAILGTVRPYIIGEQFFPEHQTGIELFGAHYERGFKIDYHLTASNGRGGSEAQQDQDLDVAFGGRLAVDTPWGLKLGGSFYRGRYTGLATVPAMPGQTYDEAAYGGDAKYDRGPLHLQTEVIARDRHYNEGARLATATGFAPDHQDFGAYLLAGYRFDRLWQVMPFTHTEHYRSGDHTLFERVNGIGFGLNFRPTPALVLKLQVSRVKFADGQGILGGEVIYYSAAQAAWVF